MGARITPAMRERGYTGRAIVMKDHESLVIYDLAGAAKRIKRAKSKAEKQAKSAITCHEIYKVVTSFRLDGFDNPSCADPLPYVCRKMSRLFIFINALYGKRAHRRLPAFQELLKQWRLRSQYNGDRFNSDVAGDDGILRAFSAWMDKEAKGRLPKPLPTADWPKADLNFPK